MYVRSTLQSSIWAYSSDNPIYELLWIRVGSDALVAALYHPPKPNYKPAELLDYIEACVEELSEFFPAAHVILAGDLNQLSNEDVEERTGLKQVIRQPTRGDNILDRVYVSNPLLFSVIRVVKSVVRSDHKLSLLSQNGSKQRNGNRRSAHFPAENPDTTCSSPATCLWNALRQS
jgi:hypothetical protein